MPIGDNHFVVPLGGDLKDKGSRLGRETILRLKKSVRVYNQLLNSGKDPAFMVTAGSPPDLKKFSENWTSMAMLMKHWLMYEANIPEYKIIFRTAEWGTFGELYSAATQILPAASMYGVSRTFHVVTSWYHKPRVMRIAQRVFPKPITNWEVHSAGGINIQFMFQELYKLPGEIMGLRSVRDKLRDWWKKHKARL